MNWKIGMKSLAMESFAIALFASAQTAVAAVRDEVRTLVTFDSAEKCKGASFNTWAGKYA